MATCHPDREHHAKGLCYPCYETTPERRAYRKAYYTTPDQRAKQKVRNATPKRREENRAGKIARSYRVSKESAELLLKLSEGKCFICAKQWEPGKNRLAIDHEHKSGIIRGAACYHCNRFLIKGGETALHQRPGLDLGVLSRYLRLELPIQAQLRSIQYTKQSCPNGAQE